MTRLTRLLGLAALVLGLASIPLYAQTQPESPQSPTTSPSQTSPSQTSPSQTSPAETSPSASQAQSQTAAQQPQTFTGTLTQTASGVSLKDSTTNTSYKVDNEDQVKQYVGKDVRITGTLDPSTNTIHVTGIDMSPK